MSMLSSCYSPSLVSARDHVDRRAFAQYIRRCAEWHLGPDAVALVPGRRCRRASGVVQFVPCPTSRPEARRTRFVDSSRGDTMVGRRSVGDRVGAGVAVVGRQPTVACAGEAGHRTSSTRRRRPASTTLRRRLRVLRRRRRGRVRLRRRRVARPVLRRRRRARRAVPQREPDRRRSALRAPWRHRSPISRRSPGAYPLDIDSDGLMDLAVLRARRRRRCCAGSATAGSRTPTSSLGLDGGDDWTVGVQRRRGRGRTTCRRWRSATTSCRTRDVVRGQPTGPTDAGRRPVRASRSR